MSTIIKSSSDTTRSFSSLTLPCGLRVLLCSDPTTERAGAGAAVNVGYFADPENIPGLAHFEEHMLFMGSEKYPRENDFSDFLTSNAGQYNAYTSDEETVYMFDIIYPNLQPALDRFAQFFISPLLSESATERELRAVDSEHSKNLQSDDWRFVQLERSTSNSTCPYSKFATGDRTTLETIPKQQGISVQEALREFHEKYYKINQVVFVVLGRQSLEELENMVRNCFSTVVVSSISAQQPTITSTKTPFISPFPTPNQRIFKVIPIKDANIISISWALPPIDWNYRDSTTRLLSHLFGHEGEGSILALLKKKNVLNALSAGVSTDTSLFSIFHIQMDCTLEGITKHVQEIISTVFSYRDLLAKASMIEMKRIFNELKLQMEIDFRFMSKPDPFSFLREMASNMLIFPTHYAVSGKRLLLDESFNEQSITQTLNTFITRDNAQILIAYKGIESATSTSNDDDGDVWQTEKWYGTKYVQTSSQWEMITTPSITSTNNNNDNLLHLPTPNEFLPTHFTLVPGDPYPIDPSIYDAWRPPSRVSGCPETLHLWHKRDTTFKKPKAIFMSVFRCPLAYASPRSSILAEIATYVIRQVLNEFAYPAEIAGLSYSFDNNVSGFVLAVSGYNDKLNILLKRLMDTICNVSSYQDEQLLDRMCDLKLREWNNFFLGAPYQVAMYETSVLLNQPRWHFKDKCTSMERKRVTVEELTTFIKTVLLGGGMTRIDCLVIGNVTRQSSIEWAESVWRNFMFESYTFQRPKVVMIPLVNNNNSTPIEYHLPAKDSNESNGAVEFVCQFGPLDGNAKMTALATTVIALGKEPCFNTLRTQKTLGYIVDLGTRRDNMGGGGVIALRIIVQSATTPIDGINTHIQDFLQEFRKIVVEMSLEEFNKHIDALVVKRLEKDMTLHAEFKRWWGEIEDESFWWNKAQQVARELKYLTKAQVLAYMDEYVLGNKARWLVVGVHAGKDAISNTTTTQRIIQDGNQWKNEQVFWGGSEFFVSGL
jgi:insulysin